MTEYDLFSNSEDETFSEGSDDYRVKPEDFKDIFVIPSDWTVSTLRQELDDIVDLDPDFQRRSVWSLKAKSRFIESLALGIPIPQILLAESKEDRNRFLVLDGKQRLITIKEFFHGQTLDGKPFRLEGLEDLGDLNKKTWKEIEIQNPKEARSIDGSQIRTAIIRGWRNDNILYEIFHRLNAGSVKLSPMELRMSLIRGPFIKTVIKETSSPSSIHEMLGLTYPDKRMKDVEIVIRHMAFQDGRIVYKGNLKIFLDEYCQLRNEKRNTIDVHSEIRNIEELATAGIRIFPDKKFGRKYLFAEDKFEASFNRAIFDVQAATLADPKTRTLALNEPDKFVELFKQISSDINFRQSIETTTKSIDATKYRFNKWISLVESNFNTSIKRPAIADARNKS